MDVIGIKQKGVLAGSGCSEKQAKWRRVRSWVGGVEGTEDVTRAKGCRGTGPVTQESKQRTEKVQRSRGRGCLAHLGKRMMGSAAQAAGTGEDSSRPVSIPQPALCRPL